MVACCKNQTCVLGNVSRQRLDDIWRGDKVRLLREALGNYRFETGCEFCEWDIVGGGYQTAYPRIFEEFPVPSAEPKWPEMIEFSGSNTCNFECIMCFGELSSLIRARREGLPPLAKVYSEQFFQDLRKFLPHLQMAKFLGGEPFLSYECFRIWDMMIEDGLITPCHVTTNGSLYNAKVERVLEALPVSLSISIDGATKETVEKIRVNAHYEELIDHVYRFRDYTRRRGTYMSLTYCLMRQNWHEFGDFLLYAQELGCDVFVNTVIDPSHCSLYTLPPGELIGIVNEMSKQEVSLIDKLRLNRGVWDDNLRKLRDCANEKQVEGVKKVKQAAFEARRDGEKGTRSHVTAAWKLLDNGLHAEALEEVLKTPETHPHYYHALILCGHVRRLMGDLDGAEQDLNRALQMSQRRPEVFTELAWVRFDQNRTDEGLANAQQALALIDEDEELEVDAYDVLGFLHIRMSKISEARQALDRMLHLQPESVRVRVRRGLAFQMAGLRDEALAEVEVALVLDPNDEEARKLKEDLQATGELCEGKEPAQ